MAAETAMKPLGQKVKMDAPMAKGEGYTEFPEFSISSSQMPKSPPCGSRRSGTSGAARGRTKPSGRSGY